MRIPKTLKVGGIKYKVERKQALLKRDSKFAAMAKHRQALIEIALIDQEGEPYNIQKVEECFIHELLHCIDSVYNNQKLDEDTIDRFSQGLYQVLKDNKLLRE